MLLANNFNFVSIIVTQQFNFLIYIFIIYLKCLYKT